MKRRRAMSLAAACMLSLAAAGLIVGGGGAGAAPVGTPAPETAPALNPPAQGEVRSANTINGSSNPELIPDHIAYSLLFRFLSGRTTEAERNRARSYIKMIFRCEGCALPTPAASEEQINALIAVSDEYAEKVRLLDLQATQLKATTLVPGQELSTGTRTQLLALQAQKNALVLELVATLPGRVGPAGAEKIRKFMTEYFKPKIKLHRSGPTLSQGGTIG